MNDLFMTQRDDSDQNRNTLTLSIKLTNKEIVAVTDLFSLVNQCPHQAIWPYTDQSVGRVH